MDPMRTMRTAAERVPGSERVRGVFDDMLDTVGIVSPRARRVAAYTGAGILGVAGVIEWPVAVAGAAAVWLTQPRPADMDGEATDGARTQKRTTKQAASRSRSGNGSRTAKKGSSKSTAAKSTAAKRTAKKTTSASRAKAGGRKKA
ncbi:hypothetical protein G4Z16_31725 [Streptomyces bathyalis]|uniref:Uncharacterized protein n=1 Tax=Streptomyces bathyalis TaxID=2710756 RepID=A0A7T1T283_9ACTN|nr:hypothetical protein [Streptomyces bathyalis]QPP05032.1 hypothetical protein G4Z16_31725 [Streptomyces bathyalis]